MLPILFALVVQTTTTGGRDPSLDEPVSTTLAELSRSSIQYHDRRIRVVGDWDVYDPAVHLYLLRDGAYKLCVVLHAPTALTELLGRRVEVRGRFVDSPLKPGAKRWPSCERFYVSADDVGEAPAESRSRSEPFLRVEVPSSVPSSPEPEILYTTPHTGTREIAPDTTFTIHFSLPMDEASLRSHVVLREGPIGEPPSSAVEIERSYDPDKKTLTLTPTRPLGHLKRVQVVLLRGITGVDGAPLHVEPPPPQNLESRRSAVRHGENLDELLVLEFTTRGY
jgi:Bacterial Ig-like domain